LRTTDVSVLTDILLKAEYGLELPTPPRVIIDAGANIGMASVFFANKYPEARIIAIEPEASNFQLLRKNTSFYPNITCVEGALWKTDAPVNLSDPGGGHWGFQTFEAAQHENGRQVWMVNGITMDTLMDRFGIERIDFLKLDIEGAEKEVFENPSSWIDKVAFFAIELHDSSRDGCSRAVYGATKGFQWQWRRGETLYIGRGKQKQPEALPSTAARRCGRRPYCRIEPVAES
jgi:FkbM family methyltransferase